MDQYSQFEMTIVKFEATNATNTPCEMTHAPLEVANTPCEMTNVPFEMTKASFEMTNVPI